MRKQLTIITFILVQLSLVFTPFLAQQAAASSPATGTVFGFIWLDVDGDGLYNLNESPRTDVPVELKNADGELVKSTTTDQGGIFMFSELQYGEYAVWVESTSGTMYNAGTIEIAEVNGTSQFDIAQMPAPIDDSNMLVTPPATTSVFLPLINS